MIRYSLQCKKGHQFEGWFANSDAFDSQAAKKQLVCPSCGSKSVAKALMAPGVVKSEGKSASKRARKAAPRSTADSPEAPTSTVPEASVPAAAPDPAQAAAHRELRALMRKLRTEVLSKSEYVGPRFPEEARKMHHDETPARGIYGEATADEARALVEEGIDFLPLPTLPEDHN